MAKKTQAEKAAQNEDAAKGNDDPMNDDEEPNFSDPEGFVDDITDEGKLSFIFSSYLVQKIRICRLLLHCKHGTPCVPRVTIIFENFQRMPDSVDCG